MESSSVVSLGNLPGEDSWVCLESCDLSTQPRRCHLYAARKVLGSARVPCFRLGSLYGCVIWGKSHTFQFIATESEQEEYAHFEELLWGGL